MWKISTFILYFTITTPFLAQNTILKPFQVPISTLYSSSETNEEIRPFISKNLNYSGFRENRNKLTDIDDIIFNNFPQTGNSNFGFFGQDVMLQWFEAPADMIINAAGFNCSENEQGPLPVELKLVKVNWSKEKILENANAMKLGYYIASESQYGITPFRGDPEYSGEGWVDLSDEGLGEIFGDDLWSNGGNGVDIVPIDSDAINVYQWVEMESLDNKPEVKKGEIIGVAVKNKSTNLGDDRIGFLASNENELVGYKFYMNGRNPDQGDNQSTWWARKFIWDFALDVTLTGDRAPQIQHMDTLHTTISTNSRAVTAIITDDNPRGGNSGVESAWIFYSIDDEKFDSSLMVKKSGDEFIGTIPGALPDMTVEYFIKAMDINGNSSTSEKVSYFIFSPTNGQRDLVVWNTDLPNYSGYYFDFGRDVTNFDYDFWNFGPLPIELAFHYHTIIENTTLGPKFDNREVIKNWLEAFPDNNYMLWGDEWLGFFSNWEDKSFSAGDFEYDILGIEKVINNIHDPNDKNTTWSDLYAVEGTILGGDLYDLHQKISSDSGWNAPIQVDVEDVLGFGSNSLDGIIFKDDVEVFLNGKGDDGNLYAVGGSRALNDGNKIAFITADPLAMQSDFEFGVERYWYGISDASPANRFYNWVGWPHHDFTPKITLTLPQETSLGEEFLIETRITRHGDYHIHKLNMVLLFDSSKVEWIGGELGELFEDYVSISFSEGAENIKVQIASPDSSKGKNGLGELVRFRFKIKETAEVGRNAYFYLKDFETFDSNNRKNTFYILDYGKTKIIDRVSQFDYSSEKLIYSLNQNYPNPFNPTTEISYSLADDSFVTITIYDILGNKVEELVNDYKRAGKYTTNLDASSLASGVYLYKLEAKNFVDVKKMILLK